MKSLLNPYLNFNGNAREAMEFYNSVFGGKLTMSTFKEYGAAQDPADENRIMHAQLETDDGIAFMAADTMQGMDYRTGTNYSVSLSGDNEEELTKFYQGLSAGGAVIEPLRKAPWGDTFGMFNDKYGVNWMVNITAKKA